MAKKLDLDAELDRIYGDPPEDFVAERNELVKALKKDGRGDEAAEVKGLKKPTRPAALVNWLSREREKDVRGLAAIADRMRDPKAGADPKKLRAAVAEEREAIHGLVEAAAEELKERGGPAATLDRVTETLRAMASDPEVEELVLSRRLEREQEASTIGFAPEGGVSFTPSKAAEEKREKKQARKAAKPKAGELKKLRAQAKAAEGAAEVAESEVEEAEGRVEEAETELEAARTALKEAKAKAREARSAAKKAAGRLKAAEGKD